MKTFGKIIICIIVVVIAILSATLIFNKGKKNTTNTGTNVSNIENQLDKENKDYIGIEENKEEPEETKEDEEEKNTLVDEKKEQEEKAEKNEQQKEPELTGEDKAIDVVKKQYVTDGETVSVDVHHKEGDNYIVSLKAGTAITWYLVNGTTWEVEEY